MTCKTKTTIRLLLLLIACGLIAGMFFLCHQRTNQWKCLAERLAAEVEVRDEKCYALLLEKDKWWREQCEDMPSCVPPFGDRNTDAEVVDGIRHSIRCLCERRDEMEDKCEALVVLLSEEKLRLERCKLDRDNLANELADVKEDRDELTESYVRLRNEADVILAKLNREEQIKRNLLGDIACLQEALEKCRAELAKKPKCPCEQLRAPNCLPPCKPKRKHHR